MRKKKVAVLGSTGSIGRQTIDVLRGLTDTHELVFIANDSNWDGLTSQRAEFPLCRAYHSHKNVLFDSYEDQNGRIVPDYLCQPETYGDADIVVNGIAGMNGIKPSIAVLQAGKILATANKESLVCFGKHLKEAERKFGGKIIPVDSEHSALYQCIDGKNDYTKLTVTASGGAFRDLPLERLKTAKAADALKHPNWIMGSKVTIDCATMVNKAFELAEAAVLFETENVDAILHRESIIHALATYADGSVKASLGSPDMRIPIQFALTCPDRVKNPAKSLHLTQLQPLTFAPIDENRYPAFSVLKDLPKKSEADGTVAVAADEILVDLYLKNKIAYYDVAKLLEKTLTRFMSSKISDVEDIFRMEKEIRAYITSIVNSEVSLC